MIFKGARLVNFGSADCSHIISLSNPVFVNQVDRQFLGVSYSLVAEMNIVHADQQLAVAHDADVSYQQEIHFPVCAYGTYYWCRSRIKREL